MGELNHEMIQAAKNRIEVHVEVEGMKRRARLVAWEPKRGNRREFGRCRVEFSSGSRATVSTSRVTVIEEGVTSGQ